MTAFWGESFLDWLIEHEVIPAGSRRVIIDIRILGGVTLYIDQAKSSFTNINDDYRTIIGEKPNGSHFSLGEHFKKWLESLVGGDINRFSRISIDMMVEKPVQIHVELFGQVAAIESGDVPEELFLAPKIEIKGPIAIMTKG